jgi:hypothetical protein
MLRSHRARLPFGNLLFAIVFDGFGLWRVLRFRLNGLTPASLNGTNEVLVLFGLLEGPLFLSPAGRVRCGWASLKFFFRERLFCGVQGARSKILLRLWSHVAIFFRTHRLGGIAFEQFIRGAPPRFARAISRRARFRPSWRGALTTATTTPSTAGAASPTR